MTSAKGKICLPYNAVYGSCKYAIEAFSDMVRLEMARFGVKVVVVEPGDFGGTTGMLSAKTVRLGCILLISLFPEKSMLSLCLMNIY